MSVTRSEKQFSLAGYQRSYLKKLAHHLKPVVMIGHGGLSPEVLSALGEALDHHELVKIRFQDNKEERRELLELAAKNSGAEIVALLGNVGILFRSNYEKEHRIHLPKRKA